MTLRGEGGSRVAKQAKVGRLSLALLLMLAGCTTAPTETPGQAASPSAPSPSFSLELPTPTPSPLTPAAALGRLAPLTAGYLAPGSDSGVLPGPVLIADEDNNRLLLIDPQGRTLWQFPRPGDLAPGQTFLRPDDVFFSADGRQIVATQEEDQVVSVIDIETHRIVYRYGVPGHHGSAIGYLSNPDDAMLLPDGRLLIADIINCRLLLIPLGATAPSAQLGTTRSCRHAPPSHFGSPNGAFPMRDGQYLVTEIHGDWVDAIGLDGSVSWTAHPPGVAYPSDANEISDGRYLIVDYSSPGQIVIFDRTGLLLWRYRPTGPAQLDHPSLALPLPNGDVLATDDHNHRLFVVDPRTNQIIWQYGHTGSSGAAPGYLANPDGMDLLPPDALSSLMWPQ